MAIVLATEDDRKAISRRLVKIPIENEAYSEGEESIAEAKTAFEKVDEANTIFSDHWIAVTNAYLDERERIDGTQFDTFGDADIIIGATEAAGNYFYPVHPDTPINKYLIPYISAYCTGASTGINASYEIMRARDFEGLVDMALNGLLGGVNTTLSNTYNGGTSLLVISGAGIVDDSYLIVEGLDGAGAPIAVDCIVYVISGGGTNTLTVRYIGGDLGTGGIQSASANNVITDSVGIIWSDADRNDLSTATPYPNSAAAIVTYTTTYDSTWDTLLSDEDGFLVLNDDERTTQITENTTAISNIVDIRDAIIAWNVLPDTSVGGVSKFNDAGLGAFLTAISDRVTQVNARLSQITTSIGSVTDGGDGTYSGTAGAIYERYKWLDRRVNRQYGSLRRFNRQEKSEEFINALIESNENIAYAYETKIKATKLATDGDGSLVVFVEDASIFNPADFAYVIDEVQSEISLVVINVDENNNSLTLNSAVSSDYKISELARIYKLL